MSELSRALLGAAGVVLCCACSDQGDGVPTDPTTAGTAEAEPADDAEVTYHRDVAPIFDAKCTGCHQEGGIAPFALTEFEPAHARAAQIASYTAARVMPPFLIETGGGCGSFDESVALSDAQIATIGAWAEGGAVEGTPLSSDLALTARPLPTLEGGTDFALPTFAPEIQGGLLAEFDEYRCFPIPYTAEGDKFVTGYDVLPGNQNVVHHVLAMVVNPNASVGGRTNREIMQALDDESPDRAGWPCFNLAGDGVDVEAVPVIWAPGQGIVEYPGGLGVKLPSDRVLVAQVHYNLAGSPAVVEPDATRIRVRLADTVTRQGIFMLSDDLLDSLQAGQPRSLPPGQKSVVIQYTRQGRDLGIPEGFQSEIVGLFPHMHGRGRKYTFEVQNGGDFECQGRVNRWDFNWQRIYDYTSPPPFTADTQVRVTCDYDTSADTEPVLPGWGTRNEMCFVMMMLGLPPGVFL
jgi:copper type II ascorbate-dependent monooxygenase-like protein